MPPPRGPRPPTPSPGARIALVTTRAVSRGQVRVYLDTVLVATLDTYCRHHRLPDTRLEQTFATTGTHTVKLVVVGTAGRPRVDLDAFAIVK